MFEPVDIYCERTDIAFWSEPLNAITNLSFFVAAWMLAKLYTKQQIRDREIKGLIFCIALVGTGSFLFHTFANEIAQLADIIPIVAFVVFYIFTALRKLFGWNAFKALGAIAVFLFVAAQMKHVPPEYHFNGSIAYFPCLAVVVLIGSGLTFKQQATARIFYTAAALFALSLAFRSIDMAVCPTLALGTHFLWHVLNGAVLYFLTKALLDQAASRK